MQTEPASDDRTIHSLSLPTRAHNALRAASILTVSQLRALTLPDLMEFKNVGHTTAVAVLRVLHQEGIALQDWPPAPAPAPGRWLNAPLRLLDLPPLVFNALRQQGMHVVGELCRLTPAELPVDLRAPVLTALTPHGLRLQGAAAVDPSQYPLLDPLPAAWAEGSLEVLDLAPRSANALRRAGITTLGELCRLTPRQLLNIRKFGVNCLAEVRSACYRTAFYDRPADDPLAGDPVDVLDLPDRTLTLLRRAGIRTLDQLCAHSPADLLDLLNIGPGVVQEVRTALAHRGRSLQDQPSPGANAAIRPAAPPEAVTLADWLEVLLEGQPPRSREVLLLRGGLYSGQPATLEQVGTRVGVTKERVRQLELTALRRIHRVAAARLDRFGAEMAALIRTAGGVARVADLVGSITQLYPAQAVDPAAFARFAFPHCRGLVDCQDDRWAVAEADRAAYQGVVATLNRLLARATVPVPAPELAARICAEHAGLDPRLVVACLQAANLFRIVYGDRVFLFARMAGGKSRWILAALHAIGRPAHFTEVAARLREMVPVLGDMSDQNVHATLGRLPEVNRTAAGIFALKEWGLTDDTTIVDLLADALAQHGGPATADQLVRYVLARKACSERSVRHFLEVDPRFLRLELNLYALARWAAAGDAEAPFLELRGVPLQPDWIVGVLDRLVAVGRMDPTALGDLLAGFRQTTRMDDYLLYVLRRGWAVLAEDGWLAPTDRARQLFASPDPAERLARFAMSDANFQAYLILQVTEHLIRRSWSEDGGDPVAAMLTGGLAPLRPIYAVMTGRLQSRCSRLATTEERETHLLQVVRAPGVPQVFSRWVEPVTGHNPYAPIAVCNRLIARMGRFPAWPSLIRLSRIPRAETRLLCLAAALAATAQAAVDYRRLATYAARLGLACPDLSAQAAELLAWGVFLDDRDPAQVRLLSPHELVLGPADVPGGLPGGLDALRSSLWAEGVLVNRRDRSDAPPDVRFDLS